MSPETADREPPPLGGMDKTATIDTDETIPVPPTQTTPFHNAIVKAEEEAQAARNIPAPPDSGWSPSDFAGVVALLIALGLLLFTTRWTRRLFPFRSTAQREMILIDRMTTGKQTTLLLVRLRGRDYWLGETPSAITLLAEVTTPQEEHRPTPENDPEGPMPVSGRIDDQNALEVGS